MQKSTHCGLEFEAMATDVFLCLLFASSTEPEGKQQQKKHEEYIRDN